MDSARQQRTTQRAVSLYGITPARFALGWVFVFSVPVNVLLLILPLYWIEVFDRVITSGSVETLIGLTVLAVAGLMFGGLFDIVRTRLLSRLAVRFERSMAPLVLEASIADPAKRAEAGTHDMARLREFRNFVAGGTLLALVDAPFLPAFVAVLYLIHPWFGAIAVCGIIVLAGLAFVSAKVARAQITETSSAAMRTQSALDGIVKHANLIRAMGWTPGAIHEFMRLNDEALAPVVKSNERVAAIASVARVLRLIVQIGTIGLGAWLVLQHELLAGSLIASSLIISRTLQPVEGLLSAWRAMESAREAWKRIRGATSAALAPRHRTPLPPPSGALEVSRVVHRLPNVTRPILAGVSFRCRPGNIVVIIGPTGAGKSTLLRMIAGLDRPSAGTIRLDNMSLDAWDDDLRGHFIGYLPQDVELLGRSVAEAIAGFDARATGEDVVKAATLAQAHQMILSLPNGYDTEVGRDGCKLSGGQRQRIGLARALFGDRRLILLDEPDSSLDPEGEEALFSTVKWAKARQAALVIVTHRPRLLTIADFVLLLRDGVQGGFGTPSEILPRTIGGSAAPRRRSAGYRERGSSVTGAR